MRLQSFGSALRALIAVCCLLIPGLASAFPNAPADPTQRLHDYVGLFPPQEAERFEREIRAYEQLTGIQPAVVIVRDLEGLEPVQYANQIHRAWGVGRADQPGSGVVLLFAMTGGSSGRGRIFINPGRRLGQVLLDSQCGEIVRTTTIPIWNSGDGQNNRARAVEETFRAVRRQIGDAPWASRPESIRDPDTAADALRRAQEDGANARRQGTGPAANTSGSDDNTVLIVVFLILGGGALLGFLFWRSSNRSSRSSSPYSGYGGSSRYGRSSGYSSPSSSFPSVITGSSSWGGGGGGGSDSGWSGGGGGGGDSFGGGGDAGGGGGGGDA